MKSELLGDDQHFIVQDFREIGELHIKRPPLTRIETVGGEVSKVSLSGGMAKTRTFVDALANTVGREIAVASSGEATALGGLAVAASAGNGPTMSELAKLRSEELDTVSPSPAQVAEMDEEYHQWVEIEARLGETDR